jgi:hypothetical protein
MTTRLKAGTIGPRAIEKVFRMFKFLSKGNKFPIRSEITLDDAYCHSDGADTAKIYAIAPGTTELVLRFPDFEDFWQARVNKNMALSDDSLIALRDDKAMFCLQIVQDGLHLHQGGVGEDQTIQVKPSTLIQMGAKKPLSQFTSGALGLGLYHPGQFRFEVVWATLYHDAV